MNKIIIIIFIHFLSFLRVAFYRNIIFDLENIKWAIHTIEEELP